MNSLILLPIHFFSLLFLFDTQIKIRFFLGIIYIYLRKKNIQYISVVVRICI
nr:MAG TPA: hypothetical protein [Caudoviricetes sp.]